MKDIQKSLVTPENTNFRNGRTNRVVEERISLRRRSLMFNGVSSNESENDDEAERSALVASERPVTSTPVTSSPKRKNQDTPSSISSPQKEHFQGCLKLYAENKITKDNAWNLQLIDFMTSMIRRHDKRMENLQMASAVVDASTRIYSLRVDGVYHDVMKMAGGLVKASNARRGKKDDEDEEEGNEPLVEGQTQNVKKKRKKLRGAIADPKTLNGDADLNEAIDPFLERLAAQTGDVTSSNRAFNATLPIDPKTYMLIISTEQPYLEPLTEELCEDLELTERVVLLTKLLPPFTNTDEICEPFTNFSITNWDPDSEKGDRVSSWLDENRLNYSQQAMAFDMNAEVEPIPQDNERNFDNLIGDDEPLGGMESDEETDLCAIAANHIVPRPAAFTAAIPTNGILPATLDKRLEYSYCAAWAGPTHWRPKVSRAPTEAGTSTSKPTKSRRGVIDFMEALNTKPVQHAPALPQKICISRKTLALSHVWNENNFRKPIDRGLSESHLCKLFLKKSTLIQRARAEPEVEPVEEPEGAADYDYNNENDTSYCVASQPLNEENAEDPWEEPGVVSRASNEPTDFAMVEPPAKVAKVFIPYAMRAKKIDMKNLKRTSWRVLTAGASDDAIKPTVPPTTFRVLFEKLPEKLTSTARESLSLPLAMLAVLHLVNENDLVLQKCDDINDFKIFGRLGQA